MFSLDINFVKDREGQKLRKDLTPEQILREINKFKYKNFSNTVCKSFSTRPLKKIVVDLAASLFQDHKQGKLTEDKFNKFTQGAVSKIMKQGSCLFHEDNLSEQMKNQIVNNTLQQGLRDVFTGILETSNSDELVKLIKDAANWSGYAKYAKPITQLVTVDDLSSMSEEHPVRNNPQYSTTQATLKLYTQQWLSNKDFIDPAPVGVNSNLSSPELSSGTIQDKVKLALDLNPRGQILLSINNNQELKEFIELTCKTDLLTDKKIAVDLNLVLNDDSATILHSINVNTKDLIFRTDIKQAAKLTEIVKKRREGTQEALLETLRNANPHMQFIEASRTPNFYSQTSFDSSLLDSEIPHTKVGFSCKSFYDVQVIPLENDFRDKSISEILLIKKNGNTTQLELLETTLKEKHLEKADFITSNYNEFVESLSSRITTVSDEASRKKIAALFIKSQVLVLSGIESHSFEKLSNDEFAAYIFNEHFLKSSLEGIIKEKSSSLSVSVDAYLPNTNSSEQFSQALRERFSRVTKTDDATYLMLDFKLNSNQNFISSIVRKFNDRDQAKSFVNEYCEQRFQLSGSNLEKPDSKLILKKFVENIQGNYGISKQNLLEVIQSCEKYFADNNFPAIPQAVQDYLTPKDILIERVLTQSFKDPSFNNYSQEQKSLYIDLQKQSQELSNSDFSNYIITNLFEKYFENVEKRPSTEGFNQFVSRSIAVVNSIDSSLEQALVFNREPDLAKISTNASFQAVSEVLKNPKTLITNILPFLDKTFIHDLPGYNQITDQVKGAFLDTLLGNSSFEMVSDTLVKLLQGSIPSTETVLTVPVNEDFNPDLYNRVISNNGREAQVLAIPPRVGNDELLAKILEQCEIHLADFAKQANLSEDTLRQVFSNSHFGKILETFADTDANAKQALSKKIISSELERNFPGKLFSDLISTRSHEILNESAIQKQFLFAKLEPSENSTKILADINKLYEFITNMNSKDSPRKRFNGLVLDEASVEYHASFYERLKGIIEPAAMKQAFFDGINSEPKNQHEAAKLGIDFDKYKEFRIDILLMQRQGSSEEEIKEFIKLNLVSVFETLPENNADNLKAIGEVVKNVDSRLTSDMKAHSLSLLNLEFSIKAALDTPANKIKNQMQTALDNVFTSNTDIKLPETIKNINAPEIQFYLETQKLATEMRLAGTDPAGINNAVFGKLATYINQAAGIAKLEDFNILALRDSEKEFVANLLNNLRVSNKALDTYFTAHKAEAFEASVQNVFQPSSRVSILDSVNSTANVQALIDNAVINLLVAPDEFEIPRNKDIRQAYIEASRELINSHRANPGNEVAIVKGLVSELGAFTQNIKDENSSRVLEAEALFYGQYKAFTDLSEQVSKLLTEKPEFNFLQKTFSPGHGYESTLSYISEALQSKETFGTEYFIQSYLLADQGANSSPNAISESILADKLNIGEKEEIDSLALISLVLKGSPARQAVAQELKEYLEAKNALLTNTVDGGKIPYIDTASTHTKLQAGIDLGEELSFNSCVEDGLVKNAVTEGIQAVIDSVKTAHGKDSTVKLISNNYPSEALADIITKSIFGESQNLDASVYKLYKDSGYNPEVLKQTETILVGLNNLTKAGEGFELCPALQAKCTELNTSWEAASSVNLNINRNLRLDFTITEEVKLSNDNLSLVNAYVNLRRGFSTVTGGTDAEKRSRASENLRLIEEFKETYNKQNSGAEYNAQNPVYITALEDLNRRYSTVVEAHGVPSNNAFVKNITGFIKESDDLLIQVSNLAQVELIKVFQSAEIAKSQPATDEQITQKADAYVKTYNQMQAFYRQNPASFEDYIDKMVDAALNPSTKQGNPIAKANGLLGTFANIIQVLDGIFEDILVGSPKANFTPLLEIYNKIRQEQGKKLY